MTLYLALIIQNLHSFMVRTYENYKLQRTRNLVSKHNDLTQNNLRSFILMYEDVSPSHLTLYSSDLCLCEHPVHSSTQICVGDTVCLQILGTVYNCAVR